MPPRSPRPAVHKFGGAALADADAIGRALDIMRQQQGPIVIVVSALSGITDLLLELVSAAERGETAAVVAGADQFRQRHHAVARQLLGRSNATPVLSAIDDISDELEALVRALSVLREASPRVRDHVISRGERLSARLVTAALQSRGRKAQMVDAVDAVITDGPYGDASPDLNATRNAARGSIVPLLGRGFAVVVPGFLGRAPDGGTATLGRGGSDLTATTLARAIDAERVTLWKDVPGLLTADPRVVPDARLLPLVHPSEAAELAYYGAKVLHPRALLPLHGKRITLHVRPFGEPTATGTEISTRREIDPPPVRSLSAVPHQALVTVAGSGILGVPGMSARTFGALQAAGISVSLIAQASSEYTIDFTIPASLADKAIEVLGKAFRAEIAHGEIEPPKARTGVSIIAVVGLRMAGHPGIAARVFDALESAEVNVVAIAQGSAEHNISIVLDERSVPAALRRIHAAFQLGKAGGGRPRRRTGKDVILLGAGTIGRAVLELLAAHPAKFASLRLIAVIDRSGLVSDSAGLDADAVQRIVRAKRSGRAVADLPGGERCTPAEALARMIDRALIRPVLIDATADDTMALLTRAAESGFDLVLANKRPVTAPLAMFTALEATLARHGGRLRQEATVGAGLPLVIAVRQLIDTGDRVTQLEGCLSGTLGTVLTALDHGTPFSAAVRDAMQRGMTEPDPRDDLSGTDVARKTLILARLLGQKRELDDVACAGLVRSGRRGTTASWLAKLPNDDTKWAERAARARGAGGVLRFVASVSATRCSAGLEIVPQDHPLGQLQGSANRLVIHSARYQEPMVITGPGAGPDVTATGVLADLLALTGA
jgi:aspartokinase/homoserine dehydrogenase 1